MTPDEKTKYEQDEYAKLDSLFGGGASAPAAEEPKGDPLFAMKYVPALNGEAKPSAAKLSSTSPKSSSTAPLLRMPEMEIIGRTPEQKAAETAAPGDDRALGMNPNPAQPPPRAPYAPPSAAPDDEMAGAQRKAHVNHFIASVGAALDAGLPRHDAFNNFAMSLQGAPAGARPDNSALFAQGQEQADQPVKDLLAKRGQELLSKQQAEKDSANREANDPNSDTANAYRARLGEVHKRMGLDPSKLDGMSLSQMTNGRDLDKDLLQTLAMEGQAKRAAEEETRKATEDAAKAKHEADALSETGRHNRAQEGIEYSKIAAGKGDKNAAKVDVATEKYGKEIEPVTSADAMIREAQALRAKGVDVPNITAALDEGAEHGGGFGANLLANGARRTLTPDERRLYDLSKNIPLSLMQSRTASGRTPAVVEYKNAHGGVLDPTASADQFDKQLEGALKEATDRKKDIERRFTPDVRTKYHGNVSEPEAPAPSGDKTITLKDGRKAVLHADGSATPVSE